MSNLQNVYYIPKKLQLAFNSLSNQGATKLANALIENQALTYLDLTWNHIRDKSVIALTSAIRFIYHRPLSIILQDNPIAQEPRLVLYNALQFHAIYLENRAKIINSFFDQVGFPTGVKNIIWGYENISLPLLCKNDHSLVHRPQSMSKLGFRRPF